MSNTHNKKEEFCSACVTIPLAFAGTGLSAYGGTTKSTEENRQNKKLIFWIGFIVALISIILSIYFLVTCKTCR